MQLLNVPLGLLFNFHEFKLVDKITRLILPGANKPCTEANEGNEEREPSLKRRLDKAQKSQDRLENGQRLSPRGPIRSISK